MLATNHLIKSQYNPIWTINIKLLSNPDPIKGTPINTASAAKYHISVTGRPVKVRFGRSGTCTQETIHLQYITMTQGVGMTNRRPINNTRRRQVNSQSPNSIESGPPP